MKKKECSPRQAKNYFFKSEMATEIATKLRPDQTDFKSPTKTKREKKEKKKKKTWKKSKRKKKNRKKTAKMKENEEKMINESLR